MITAESFSGFPKDGLKFLESLAKNNNKAWFEAHRDDYESHLLAPARAFVTAVGQALETIAPAIHAEPKVNRSLFRIQRDTRFSKDKTPYKTHLALFWWEGAGKRMECSGFYFQLQPEALMLGAGVYQFTRPQLKEYRLSVVHPEHGPALAEAVTDLGRRGYEVGGRHYKRVPRGLDKDHPLAELLLHNGVYAWFEAPPPKETHSEALVGYCFDKFIDMLPLHNWLRTMIDRVAE